MSLEDRRCVRVPGLSYQHVKPQHLGHAGHLGHLGHFGQGKTQHGKSLTCSRKNGVATGLGGGHEQHWRGCKEGGGDRGAVAGVTSCGCLIKIKCGASSPSPTLSHHPLSPYQSFPPRLERVHRKSSPLLGHDCHHARGIDQKQTFVVECDLGARAVGWLGG